MVFLWLEKLGPTKRPRVCGNVTPKNYAGEKALEEGTGHLKNCHKPRKIKNKAPAGREWVKREGRSEKKFLEGVRK